MADLYLLKYNNYYNRICKRETSISDYRKYLVKSYNAAGIDQEGTDTDENGNSNIVRNVNFIEGDYMNTEQVVNWVGDPPDYLLVTEYKNVNVDGEITEQELIQSRWFVMSYDKQNFAQIRLNLRRDVIVDEYNNIKEQPCFIEKGTPIDINDTAIFNKEDMSFNQIKQAEYTLTDSTECPWIVGYMPRDAAGGEISTKFTLKGTEKQSVSSIANWSLSKYITTPMYHSISSGKATSKFYLTGDVDLVWFVGNCVDYLDTTYNVDFTQDDNSIKITNTYGSKTNKDWWSNNRYQGSLKCGRSCYAVTGTGSGFGIVSGEGKLGGSLPKLDRITGRLIDGATVTECYSSANVTMPSNAEKEELESWNGQLLYVQTEDTYYKVNIKKSTEKKNLSASTNTFFKCRGQDQAFVRQDLGYGVENCKSAWTSAGYYWMIEAFTYDELKPHLSGTVTFNTYTIELEKINMQIKFTIPDAENRYHLSDSPYDMFCIPYMNPGFKIIDGSTTYSNLNRDAGLVAATQIPLSLASENLYDIQLLPYCPIKTVVGNNQINLAGYDKNYIYQLIVGDNGQETLGDVINVILFCTDSEFELDIPFSIPEETTVLDKKIKSETEFWRLCSPNYSGVFEFNPQMNRGVSSFHVDCNYKPYSPYIRVSPNFGGLYGKQFDDSRGLVCGGDFSLPLVTSAWAEYQYNNKNYQQIFDRGIENMQINNAVQREKEQWQAVAGTMQAFAQGKQMGDSSFLGLGGLFGVGNATGAAAAAFSAKAAKRDIELNDKLRNETLDYSKDMFGYQLGNIQALSQGLAKVSSFTINNKIFPFLEQYGCDEVGADEEHQYQTNALKNKLKYNGFTIMRIDQINNFVQETETYVKGKLIRIPDSVSGDFHIASALVEEVNKGFFIQDSGG